ncbi:hypothetical protein D9M72_232720 [compost metagenome]
MLAPALLPTRAARRRGQNTTITGWLHMAFELGEQSWKLSLGDGVRGSSRHTLVAGDLNAVLQVPAKAKAS